MSKCWECGCKVGVGAVRCLKCIKILQGGATTGFWTSRSRIQTGQDGKELVQPLNRDGYSNPDFDKLYGQKTINPFWGTDRDHRTRGMTKRQKERHTSKVKDYKVKQGTIRK